MSDPPQFDLSESDRMALDALKSLHRSEDCVRLDEHDTARLHSLLEYEARIIQAVIARERALWLASTVKAWGLWAAAVAALLKFGPEVMHWVLGRGSM